MSGGFGLGGFGVGDWCADTACLLCSMEKRSGEKGEGMNLLAVLLLFFLEKKRGRKIGGARVDARFRSGQQSIVGGVGGGAPAEPSPSMAS